MAVALAANAGCTVVPRGGAAAEEVFRNAAGEAVAVPWGWAGGQTAERPDGRTPPGEGAP